MDGSADGSADDDLDSPLRIDWLEAAEFADGGLGRLGLTFMPGKRGASLRYPGRIYRRELSRDLETLRKGHVRLLVLLVEDHELARWGDPTIVERGRDAGISIVRRPIPDGEAPPSVAGMDAIVEEIARAREVGDAAVACMGGVGRTGTVAACALVSAGHSAADAIARVRAVRHPTAVETPGQVAFVQGYERHVAERGHSSESVAVNERWVCKRCFADNDETAAACHRCGLIRGAESTDADQSAWGASQQPEAAASESDRGGVIRQLLRFWWIPAAAIALAVGYFTTAQRGDDGTLSTAGNVSVTDLRVGDCFNGAEFAGEDVEIGDVDGVPCEEPHTFEVFAVADYNGSAYPATDAAFETAFGEVCVPPFEAYVGVPYADSALYASAITPTEDGWNSGDHEFICHLHNRDQSMITGSQQGANR